MRDKIRKLAMLLKRLLAAVKGVEKAVQNQKDATNTSGKQVGDKQNPSPQTWTEVRLPRYAEREIRESNEKGYSLQKWNVIAAWATFTMVTTYAGITTYQAYQMKRATDATRESANAAKSAATTAHDAFVLEKRHTEDTDEAICDIRQNIVLGDDLETITISNSGKVSAHKIQAHVEVSRNRLPENTRIILLGQFDISQDELRISGPPIIKHMILKKLDWKQLYDFGEAIVISGDIQYENGFDDIRKNRFCQAFVVEPPSQESLSNGRPIAVGILPTCDMLPATFKHFRDLQKQKTH